MKNSAFTKCKFWQSQKGSMDMAIVLVIVVIIVVGIFSLIDYVDKKSEHSTASDTSRGFSDTKEEGFFDDEKFEGETKAKASYQANVTEIDENDLDPTQRPEFQETNARNAYYKPLSPEKRREKEKLQAQRNSNTGLGEP